MLSFFRGGMVYSYQIIIGVYAAGLSCEIKLSRYYRSMMIVIIFVFPNYCYLYSCAGALALLLRDRYF